MILLFIVQWLDGVFVLVLRHFLTPFSFLVVLSQMMLKNTFTPENLFDEFFDEF